MTFTMILFPIKVSSIPSTAALSPTITVKSKGELLLLLRPLEKPLDKPANKEVMSEKLALPPK